MEESSASSVRSCGGLADQEHKDNELMEFGSDDNEVVRDQQLEIVKEMEKDDDGLILMRSDDNGGVRVSVEEGRSEPEMEIEQGIQRYDEMGNNKKLIVMRSDDNGVVKAPEPGMVFDSLDLLVEYYEKYAEQEGFGVVRKTLSTSTAGNSKHATIACSRGGKPNLFKRNNRKPYRGIAKSGCRARVNATVSENGSCKVNSVILEHNHGLIPSRVHYVLCKPELQQVNNMGGIDISTNFQVTVAEAGGYEDASFVETSFPNNFENGRWLKFGVGDAKAIHRYFVQMQTTSANFFYAIDIDEKSRIKNVFWADGRSRAAYEEFGDIIMFDTIYLINKYNLPLANFVGVNHHGQHVLLGCALLSNEDTATFVWLFKTFLSCMHRRAPKGIITDQGEALQNTIKIVLPNSRHRWCLWHILKKLPEEVGNHIFYEPIQQTLQNIVFNSFSKEEFEESWNSFLEKFNLGDNAWLSSLYDERQCWVPVFVKDTFWAGMSPAVSSDNVNAFFDGHLNSKTTLKQFVDHYNSVLKAKVEKETESDFQSLNSVVPCVTKYHIEQQCQQAYTAEKFKEFQLELIAKVYCEVSFVGSCSTLSEYDVSEDVFVGEGEEQHQKEVHFKVHFNEINNEARCTCCLFEFKGILCKHIISVFIKKKVSNVPPKYILPRWRKDVKRCHTRVKIGYVDWHGNPELQRHDYLQKKFDEAANLAVTSEDNCKLLWDCLDQFQQRLK